MHEFSVQQVQIADPFWSPRLEMNAAWAIFHQWEQLEKTGCIDNLRIAAGELESFREGWFFADSDAYKWLDAACRIQATHPSAELRERIDALVDLLARAQQPDGYLYTYNQIHFPGQRWVNLQIEHELYCLGHLIEGCLSYDEMEQPENDPRSSRRSRRDEVMTPTPPSPAAAGEGAGLEIAGKAAALLVRELRDAGPEYTDGHEEIELALLKLYRRTGNNDYLELAERLIERRGRIRRFWRLIQQQNESWQRRREQVQAQRAAYVQAHPEHASFQLPPDNVSKHTHLGQQRRRLSALSGRMFQQHRPVRESRAPVGHAVRFTYLQTAAAMLCRERDDEELRAALEATWKRMVERRMYVTGGLGGLPEIEGFGRDYELDPEAAYAETCAALGSLFWNWEMALLTREARYADLFEWQLYNAASVGMGQDGTSYLYNNPLTCRGGIERRAWFAVPCCPSNLSRTWAALGRYLFSAEGDEVWVHQYVSCRADLHPCPSPLPSLRLDSLRSPQARAGSLGERGALRLTVRSGLPWQGQVRIRVEPESPAELALHVRIPSWTRGYQVRVNGQAWEPLPLPPDRQTPVATACGYAPHGAFYVPIRRTWAPGDTVELELPTPIVVRRPSGRVRGSRGTAAITRGPLVYCLESVNNPAIDLFAAQVDLASLSVAHPPSVPPASRGEEDKASGSLRVGDPPSVPPASRGEEEGGWVLHGRTVGGRPLTFIPYYAWANRGPSQMTVMVRV